MAKLYHTYYVVHSDVCTSTTEREHTVALPCQPWLQERVTSLRSMYPAYPVHDNVQWIFHTVHCV